MKHYFPLAALTLVLSACSSSIPREPTDIETAEPPAQPIARAVVNEPQEMAQAWDTVIETALAAPYRLDSEATNELAPNGIHVSVTEFMPGKGYQYTGRVYFTKLLPEPYTRWYQWHEDNEGLVHYDGQWYQDALGISMHMPFLLSQLSADATLGNVETLGEVDCGDSTMCTHYKAVVHNTKNMQAVQHYIADVSRSRIYKYESETSSFGKDHKLTVNVTYNPTSEWIETPSTTPGQRFITSSFYETL